MADSITADEVVAYITAQGKPTCAREVISGMLSQFPGRDGEIRMAIQSAIDARAVTTADELKLTLAGRSVRGDVLCPL